MGHNRQSDSPVLLKGSFGLQEYLNFSIFPHDPIKISHKALLLYGRVRRVLKINNFQVVAERFITPGKRKTGMKVLHNHWSRHISKNILY